MKKIFAGADCSFARIIEITKCLDLSFFDLIHSISDEQEEPFFEFTLEQEKFLAKNIIYYLFFHKIFRDHVSTFQAQKLYNLDDKKVWSILRKLEEFSLLEITTFPKVNFLVQGGLKFRREGPLQQKVLTSGIEAMANFLSYGPMQKSPVDSPFVRLFFAKVSPQTFHNFVSELKKIHDEFTTSALRDRRYLDPNDLVDTTWLFGLANCHGLDIIGSKIKNEIK